MARDYALGNFLFQQRESRGLSQNELANQLGVSGKAVSKWENGVCKPRTEIMRRLASLWDISIDELLQHDVPPKTEPDITRIVVTGGPCAGKTTALSWIQEEFSKKGYQVIFVPETATELISSGITPGASSSNTAFQKHLLDLQLAKEKIYTQAALDLPVEKVLMVFDRGVMDGKAYMSDSEFAKMLEDSHLSEVELRDAYDAVFHLVTAAKGAEKFYTLANNGARSETIEQAAALDDRLIWSWTGHPHFRMIENRGSFDDKMKNLIREISAFLGEPEPHEVERKFLVKMPDLEALGKMKNVEKNDIIQNYLQCTSDEEVRIRQRGRNGSYTYTLTRKVPISAIERIETEKRITRDEYLDLLMQREPLLMPVQKQRWCLSENGQYFELDVYPFWKDKAILEIELADPNEEVRIPQWIEVIREVTDDPAYRNSSIARMNLGL